tara:strand:- start:275 stop:439 length:165 start_codon:yes stop_codon:yes gene_type:complete
MSKKLVLEILEECALQQEMANLGGIIGGKENEKLAKQDLARYRKAVKWYKENSK